MGQYFTIKKSKIMKRLTRYLKRREIAINLLMKRPTDRFTAVTIHKLRVEIKKLRAFLNLISFYSNNFKRKKAYKPFKKLFKQAGKVRELQLEIKILKKYKLDNLTIDYSESICKLLSVEKEIFFSMLNRRFFSKMRKKFLVVFSSIFKIDQPMTALYLDEYKCLFDELQTQQSLSPYQIHEIRKWLKELRYSCEILLIDPNHIPILNDSYSHELMGQWHDYEIIINHIKLVIQNGKAHSHEIDFLQYIIDKLSTDRDTLFNNLHKVLFA